MPKSSNFACGLYLNERGKPCDPRTPGSKLCPGMTRVRDSRGYDRELKVFKRDRVCMVCKSIQRTEERTEKIVDFVPLPDDVGPVQFCGPPAPEPEPMPTLLEPTGEDPAVEREHQLEGWISDLKEIVIDEKQRAYRRKAKR